MEDPSNYYQSTTIHEGQYNSEEVVNNNQKTYVELEVVHRNPNSYDPAAIQLAHQSDLLFNYDSSPNPQPDQQQQQLHYHNHHHHHHQMISGLSHSNLQYHELEPLPSRSHHHLINLDCPSKSYDSIKSVLMLKDITSDQQNAQQVLHLSTDTQQRIKTEPQSSTGSAVGGGAEFSGPLPFWKERALQIERGTEICMHHNDTTGLGRDLRTRE